MKRIIIAAALATGVVTAAPVFALTHADLIGEPGASNNITRTVHVTPDTRYVNVTESETVNLEVNGQATTWKFDGVKPVLNLDEIIPGAPSKVSVYVKPSFQYQP